MFWLILHFMRHEFFFRSTSSTTEADISLAKTEEISNGIGGRKWIINSTDSADQYQINHHANQTLPAFYESEPSVQTFQQIRNSVADVERELIQVAMLFASHLLQLYLNRKPLLSNFHVLIANMWRRESILWKSIKHNIVKVPLVRTCPESKIRYVQSVQKNFFTMVCDRTYAHI